MQIAPCIFPVHPKLVPGWVRDDRHASCLDRSAAESADDRGARPRAADSVVVFISLDTPPTEMSCTQAEIDATMASFDSFQTMTFVLLAITFANTAIW
jgi:hypothetical protein